MEDAIKSSFKFGRVEDVTTIMTYPLGSSNIVPDVALPEVALRVWPGGDDVVVIYNLPLSGVMFEVGDLTPSQIYFISVRLLKYITIY